MCAKGERRCEEREELQLQAGAEWAVAEELEQVRAAWARLGGLTTLHRYGREHFSLLARHRHGDEEATAELAATPTWRGQRVLVVGAVV
jgi:FMN phosphatase YigB (HAD superfamily)